MNSTNSPASGPRASRPQNAPGHAATGGSAVAPGTHSQSGTRAVIHVEGLTDGYDGTTVLDRVGFAVEGAALFALLGRNGAGKSTLVQSLLGFRRPAAGRTSVFGVDPWLHRRRLMRDIAFVPETPSVPPQMTVRGAARFVATFLPRSRFDHSVFQGLLQEDDLSPNARFGRLSRGQKSSVGLALALASRPRLLVLDDPTLGLDAVVRRRTYQRLIEYQAEHGATVFLTTHDLAAMDGLATHVGFLHRGALPVCGAVDDLKRRFRLVDLDAGSEPDQLPGRIVRTSSASLGRRALVEIEGDASGPSTEQDLEFTAPTIEDLFVALLEEQPSDREPGASAAAHAA